jgi:uncharacterized OsmC-like protein
MTITDQPSLRNGINLEATLAARDALAAQPEAAAFQWRASCQWVNGTHSRSTVEEFFGLGTDQPRSRSFVYDVDHPELFAAEDNGATPVELLLVALAGCLTAGIASVAANRGIQLYSVKAVVTGEMDMQGILGIDPEVRNGFGQINVRYEIDADATADEIKAVVAQSQKRSAVFDSLTTPTNVVVDVA